MKYKIRCDKCKQECSPIILWDIDGSAVEAVSECHAALIVNNKNHVADWDDIELAGYSTSYQEAVYEQRCRDADNSIYND